jgi:hypothetical protein
MLKSAVREAVRLGSTMKPHLAAVPALEYAEQLVMPTVTAAIEQAREEGYQDGRASLAPVVAA